MQMRLSGFRTYILALCLGCSGSAAQQSNLVQSPAAGPHIEPEHAALQANTPSAPSPALDPAPSSLQLPSAYSSLGSAGPPGANGIPMLGQLLTSQVLLVSLLLAPLSTDALSTDALSTDALSSDAVSLPTRTTPLRH
jgi:hypothetical protein